MSVIIKRDALVAAQILDLVTRERTQSLSKREWLHRLAGHGYTVRETAHGDYLETLPHRVQVCALPAGLSR